jgi:trimethylamine--corrinoid protein Co-methyltransferase
VLDYSISPFDSSTVGQIVSEAIQLLREPGVMVHNDEGLDVLSEAGAVIDRNSQVVRIPERMIYEALESAPEEFFLYSLDRQPVVHYGGDRMQFDPGSAAVTILDGKTGVHRKPNTGDYVNFVKLVETLPQIDAQSTALVCSDVVQEIGDLYRLYLALCFMRKPIVTGAFRKDTWWTMYELLKLIMGGSDTLRKFPIAIFDICPSPPLLWSDLTCQNLIDCSRNNVPIQLVSMPLAGATAPVTLAGAIVQHAAENLSGVVISQMINPGSPVVWGGSPAAFDMRYGSTPMGAPETWLLNAGYVQIGKSLNLPTHVYMGMSDAKLLDAQCGMESMGGVMVAVLTGANMISGAGMLDYETCQSFEKLVIDAEMIKLVKRLLAGIQIREEPIARNIIKEMGHKPDYLRHSHTRRWFREEIQHPSDLIDRKSLNDWISSGSLSMRQRANQYVENLLTQNTHPGIERKLHAELRKVTQEAARRFGMVELPPLPVELSV